MFRPARLLRIEGFTLVELLIAISIVVVLSGVLIPGFSRYSNTQNLRQSQEQLKSDVRSIQNRALSGMSATITVTHWGVKFTPDASRYGYFTTNSPTGATCNGVSPTDWSESLPADILTRNNSTNCMYFSFNNGDMLFYNGAGIVNDCANDCNTCRIPVGYDTSTTCEWVGVNQGGLIKSLASAACP